MSTRGCLGKCALELTDPSTLTDDDIMKLAVEYEIPKFDDTLSFTADNLLAFTKAAIIAQLEKLYASK